MAGTNGNPFPSTAYSDELIELVRLARDKSKVRRERLTKAVDALAGSGDGGLMPQDRLLMDEILHTLVVAIEGELRRDLAARLEAMGTAVGEEAQQALRDGSLHLAYPFLVESRLLQDLDLIEAVQHQAIAHQLTLAMRSMAFPSREAALPPVSAPEAPVETPALCEALSNELTCVLYWRVAAAIRQALVVRFAADPDPLDDAVEAVMRARFALREALEPTVPVPAGPRELGTGEWLLNLLRAGQVAAFIEAMARHARIRQALLCRMLFEEGGEGLATACKALGLSRHFFVTTFLLCRDGRLGDKRVPEGEAERAVAFFDQVSAGTATRLLRHWRRDQRYLDALRQIDEVHPA